jgi:hypothetical protein
MDEYYRNMKSRMDIVCLTRSSRFSSKVQKKGNKTIMRILAFIQRDHPLVSVSRHRLSCSSRYVFVRRKDDGRSISTTDSFLRRTPPQEAETVEICRSPPGNGAVRAFTS